jgi:uridylate kinase
MLKATKEEGVYDDDPRRNPNARLFREISYLEVLQRGLRVMDTTATSLCMDNRIPIIVFDVNRPGNIRRAVMGEQIGTYVRGD